MKAGNWKQGKKERARKTKISGTKLGPLKEGVGCYGLKVYSSNSYGEIVTPKSDGLGGGSGWGLWEVIRS